MRRFATIAATALLGTCIGFAGGCTESAPKTEPKKVESTSGAHDHAEHAHPSTGPHSGALIELGKEEYHAELVHDANAGTVTIYILGHDAQEAVTIDAKEIRINIRHDAEGAQFELAAAPQDGDEAGQASRFVSHDKALGEALDQEGAQARLVVEIDGKSFTGAIEHDHDHGGHE